MEYTIEKDIPMLTDKFAAAPKKTLPRVPVAINTGFITTRREIMGYKIKHGKFPGNIAPINVRPYSWLPIFKALHVGDYFEEAGKRMKSLRGTVNKYNRILKPRVFVYSLDKGVAYVGRVK